MRNLLVLTLFVGGAALAQSAPLDTDESAYTPSMLARILADTARSQNDEAELAAAHEWYSTTATFTGHKRTPSGRYRPLISAWVGSRGQDQSNTEVYFGGELPELEFEQ